MKPIINKKRNFIKATGLITIGLMTLVSCNSKNEVNEPIQLDEKENSNVILLTTSQFSTSNMALGTLSKQVFHNTVKTNGMFDVPPESRASVSAYFGGYVKELNLLPGQEVKKGQVLFTLENPDYVQIQENFLVAKAQLGYLKSDYERQKELAKENVTSQKNFLKAESEYRVTSAIYESLKKKLGLMNINPNAITESTIQSTISVTAPISGYITTVNAERGMFLNPADIAITITGTDHLHIELSIFETDFPQVQIGQEIEFKLQKEKSLRYKAKVYLISKSIDAKKRTANVHGHLANDADAILFAPGMYVEAEIYTSTDSLLALPNEAIVAINDKYFTLLKTKEDDQGMYFERKEIQIGKTANGFTEIINYLNFNENSAFLVKGAFNLISE
ncbi:MAG: efflux RND transporter periplasmic adaptor subunit [Bacteroidetes bacterium HGW-Bacteroidetes-2]|jgi:cobalt-zinc-cadmium efflux system membrane fusion protein|nr:MAG: efflux RND transporter periplasmic adaptor subunit [Bacteroidetes bacterium HGW-Bacteroidetes-2]